ncbi:MAG: ABC transporter ATP-binding protein [Clostridiales Family XIII bacterium]|jgi:urea transport system ATP-binding protein|nr:ABC transporter ATP-binding protein [Clostridiales Family XIII bacterium]
MKNTGDAAAAASETGHPVLVATDVSSGYGFGRVLHGVSFHVSASEIVALIGRNGVGKTTLLRTIMALNRLDGGEISLFGLPLPKATYAVSGTGIAYVPQGRDIFSDFTVRENLLMGAHSSKKKEIPAILERVLSYFPALSSHLNRCGGVLSGGQQQQLAIGRALMTTPRLLLLDEPTEGIQPNIVSQIAEILDRIREEMKISIIIVEQNLKFAMRHADRFLCMQKGRIVVRGNIDELTDDIIGKYLKV